MKTTNVKLNCFIDREDDKSSIFINITDDIFNMTLQYADITEKFNEFLEINERFELYDDIDDLVSDLENGLLQRFTSQPESNDRLDLIINLRMKMRHQNGSCGDSCILCNPDIGDDPFPDFTFDIRNAETEGEM